MMSTRSLAHAAAVAVLALTLLVGPTVAEVDRQAIDDVVAGKAKVARASWWGFDPEESTEALQAAIDSGAEKVIVDNVGWPWIVDKMTLASNQELFFEKGVVVLAKKGAFKGTADALFRTKSPSPQNYPMATQEHSTTELQ